MSEGKGDAFDISDLVQKAMAAKVGVLPDASDPTLPQNNPHTNKRMIQVVDIPWPGPNDSSFEQELFPGHPAAVYAIVIKPQIHGGTPKAFMRMVWLCDPTAPLELMRFVLLRPMQGIGTPVGQPTPQHCGTLGNPFSGDPISVFRDLTFDSSAGVPDGS